MAVVRAINMVSGGISCPEVESSFADRAYLIRSKLFVMLRMGSDPVPKTQCVIFFEVLFNTVEVGKFVYIVSS
jgi:hypothetical protein